MRNIQHQDSGLYFLLFFIYLISLRGLQYYKETVISVKLLPILLLKLAVSFQICVFL